jgi:hypothetical protein
MDGSRSTAANSVSGEPSVGVDCDNDLAHRAPPALGHRRGLWLNNPYTGDLHLYRPGNEVF